MEILYAERAGSSFAAFYNTMDFTNPIKAETYNRTEAVQQQMSKLSDLSKQRWLSKPKETTPIRAGSPLTSAQQPVWFCRELLLSC